LAEYTNDLMNLERAFRRAVGEDRFGKHRGLSVSHIDLKVATLDSSGILIL
jgi:hypothetical protein